MISPSYISRILTDRSLTEAQKSDTIFGLVQDAFIDGYSIGTERLISTIKDRESVIQEHTPFDPQPGDMVVANYAVWIKDVEFKKGSQYKIRAVDDEGVQVYAGPGEGVYKFERRYFFKHFRE